MSVFTAQHFVSVRGEVDHEKPAAGAQKPSRLADCAVGRVREMEKMMQDHAVGAVVRQGQSVHIALPQIGGDLHVGQLGAGEAEHLRTPIDADRMLRPAAEQFQHPTGAGADIDERAERSLRQQFAYGALNLRFGDVQRANGVPLLGPAVEIGGGLSRPFVTNGRQPLAVSQSPVHLVLGRSLNQGVCRLGDRVQNGAQENPAAFAPPFRQTGGHKYLDVPRGAGLAQRQHLSQLSDGQLHLRQQRNDAQPGSVRKGLKEEECGVHRIQDIKKALYAVNGGCALARRGREGYRALPLAVRGGRLIDTQQDTPVMKNLSLLGLAVPIALLAGCNQPAQSNTTAAQDISEANVMADDAVSMAENALENAAMTDSDATEETMANASDLADRASEKVEDAKDKVDAAN